MNAQYTVNVWNLKSHRSQFLVCFLRKWTFSVSGRETRWVFSHPTSSRHHHWKTWLSEVLGKQMPHTLSLSQAQALPTPAFLERVPFPFAEAERVVQSWHRWLSGCLGPGWGSPRGVAWWVAFLGIIWRGQEGGGKEFQLSLLWHRVYSKTKTGPLFRSISWSEMCSFKQWSKQHQTH